MRGGFPYVKVYTDLARAIRELGELEVLAMVNSQLRDRGLQRKRQQRHRENLAKVDGNVQELR